MSTTPSYPATFSPSSYHDLAKKNIRQELRYNGEDFPRWQEKLRARVADLLGMKWFEGERVALNPRPLWKREHRLGTIEKIVLSSEEAVDFPAYVCIPGNAQPPYTWVICVQGHSTGMHHSISVDREDETVAIAPNGDRDFAIGCMERGLAAICVEQRSFGERRELVRTEPSSSGCHQAAWNAVMLGRTLPGERIFDVDRAIDYLETRDDFDPARLGVLGNSGGGMTALFSAALLPRIRFAIPSCYFCTFNDSILAMNHCACNYVPGLSLVAEMGDIAGLIAPRPLIIVNGDEDTIFPIEAAREEFRHVQKIYAAAGAPENCHHVVCQGGHRFYAEPAWATFLESETGKL